MTLISPHREVQANKSRQLQAMQYVQKQIGTSCVNAHAILLRSTGFRDSQTKSNSLIFEALSETVKMFKLFVDLYRRYFSSLYSWA